MTGTAYVPPGRAIVPVAPRPGALAAVAEGVRVRRRRTRRRALAGAALALLAALPLLLAGRDTTAGLEPAGPRPAASPSATALRDAAARTGDGTTVAGPGTSRPGPPGAAGPAASPAGAGDACPCPTPPPGDGTTPSGTLTLSGSQTSYGTVRIDRVTTVDLAAATVSYVGEYGGFAIGGVEVLYARPMADGVTTPAYAGAASVTLRPGVHRVYVFTPTGSDVTVTLPWSGQPSLTVRPAVVVTAHYHRPTPGSVADQGGGGNAIGTTNASSVTLVAATYSPAATGVTLTGCVHLPAKPCVRTVTARSNGTNARLRDRLAGDWSGYQYDVVVRGDSGAEYGVLQFLMFRYDRD
jgi:hypothetical protein